MTFHTGRVNERGPDGNVPRHAATIWAHVLHPTFVFPGPRTKHVCVAGARDHPYGTLPARARVYASATNWPEGRRSFEIRYLGWPPYLRLTYAGGQRVADSGARWCLPGQDVLGVIAVANLSHGEARMMYRAFVERFTLKPAVALASIPSSQAARLPATNPTFIFAKVLVTRAASLSCRPQH